MTKNGWKIENVDTGERHSKKNWFRNPARVLDMLNFCIANDPNADFRIIDESGVGIPRSQIERMVI